MLAMGLRSWVRGRRAGERGATTQGPDLLNQPTATIPVPDHLGLEWSGPIRPWSLARLGSIVREAVRHPSDRSLLEARHARHCLSAFWLAAPSDHLEDLIRVPSEICREPCSPVPCRPWAWHGMNGVGIRS